MGGVEWKMAERSGVGCGRGGRGRHPRTLWDYYYWVRVPCGIELNKHISAAK